MKNRKPVPHKDVERIGGTVTVERANMYNFLIFLWRHLFWEMVKRQKLSSVQADKQLHYVYVWPNFFKKQRKSTDLNHLSIFQTMLL